MEQFTRRLVAYIDVIGKKRIEAERDLDELVETLTRDHTYSCPTSLYVNWCDDLGMPRQLLTPAVFAPLERLELVGLGILALPAEIFQALPNLHHLYLAENRLGVAANQDDSNEDQGLPMDLASLRLETLDLRDNALSRLPRVLGRLTALRTLHLANNQRIDLTDERNAAVMREIVTADRLMELDLSGLGLKSVPLDLLPLSLRLLFLSDNAITELPTLFFIKLIHLSVLWVNINQLKTLPSAVDAFLRLEELNLACNNLTVLPDSLKKLIYMKRLWLGGNVGLEVTEDLCLSLRLLELLDLRSLDQQSVPADTLTLKNLRALAIEGNKISTSVLVPFWQFKGLRRHLLQWERLVALYLLVSFVLRVVFGSFYYQRDGTLPWSLYIGIDAMVAIEFLVCLLLFAYITQRRMLSCLRSNWLHSARASIAILFLRRPSASSVSTSSLKANKATKPTAGADVPLNELATGPGAKGDAGSTGSVPAEVSPRVSTMSLPQIDEPQAPTGTASNSNTEIGEPTAIVRRQPYLEWNFVNAVSMTVLILEATQVAALTMPPSTYLTGSLHDVVMWLMIDIPSWNAFGQAMFVASVVAALSLRLIVELRARMPSLAEADFVVSSLCNLLFLPVINYLVKANACTTYNSTAPSGIAAYDNSLQIYSYFIFPRSGETMPCYSSIHIVMVTVATLVLWPCLYVGVFFPCYWQARFPTLDIVYDPTSLVLMTIIRLLLMLTSVILSTALIPRQIILVVLALAIVAITVLRKPCLVAFADHARITLYVGTVVSAILSLAFELAGVEPTLFIFVLLGWWVIVFIICVGLLFSARRTAQLNANSADRNKLMGNSMTRASLDSSA